MARPRTASADYQVVSVRFPKEILDQCRDEAAQQDRSLNEQLLHMVKRWLAAERHKSLLVGSPTP
jgi:Arc-like DNA binding domain